MPRHSEMDPKRRGALLDLVEVTGNRSIRGLAHSAGVNRASLHALAYADRDPSPRLLRRLATYVAKQADRDPEEVYWELARTFMPYSGPAEWHVSRPGHRRGASGRLIRVEGPADTGGAL